MTRSRNKLYVLLSIACLAGYIWLYFSVSAAFIKNSAVEVCLIKHVTHIPCPSCGSTRSVISLLKGNFLEALRINPMGLIVAGILIAAPLWVIRDVIMRSHTLFRFYQKTEAHLKKPLYAVPLILLLIINWVWNITKGL